MHYILVIDMLFLETKWMSSLVILQQMNSGLDCQGLRDGDL
jgi:hypothetical protein